MEIRDTASAKVSEQGLEHGTEGRGSHATVLLSVNGQPVRMPKHEATGLEVKEAAIAQHVQIELTFILELEEHGKTRIISDAEHVPLHDGTSFTAIRNDDNS